jgi:3-oxoacyl-[acyl-carrier protein] reductase
MNDWFALPGARDWAASQGVRGRVGRPDDVGDIIAFLASDDARWINGQVIDATGGGVLGVTKMSA